MGDANPIRTLEDYSKPSHEGYRNTVELPEGNNVKDRKTPQRNPDVPTTSKRISVRSMDSFQGLTPKSPSSWHRPLAPIQCLMEAYIAPMQPTQVNKITSSCKNPEQAFVEYASSRIDEAGGEGNPKNTNATEREEEQRDAPQPELKDPTDIKKISPSRHDEERGIECTFWISPFGNFEEGSVVFRKPFVEATGLIYERKEGTITFEKDKEKIMFKMSHKLEMFKHIDFTDIKTDRIPPFVIESNDDNSEKTHYSNSFDLGPEYKHDENVCRAIRSLIAMKAKRNKEEVMFHAVIHTGNVGIKRLLDDLRVTATKY
ncbi:hypothetical protein Tco_1169434 [Tanacetum coccineum]